MRKIYYRKLVRDKIPRRIEESGGKYAVRTLSVSSFKKEILKKVEEEAGGLARAKVKSEIVAETGDLLDVLTEVKKAFGITSNELSKSRTREMKKREVLRKESIFFGQRILAIVLTRREEKNESRNL